MNMEAKVSLAGALEAPLPSDQGDVVSDSLGRDNWVPLVELRQRVPFG